MIYDIKSGKLDLVHIANVLSYFYTHDLNFSFKSAHFVVYLCNNSPLWVTVSESTASEAQQVWMARPARSAGGTQAPDPALSVGPRAP